MDYFNKYYNKKIQLATYVINDVLSICDGKKMLVFGLGYDSPLWYNATNKNTYFILFSNFQNCCFSNFRTPCVMDHEVPVVGPLQDRFRAARGRRGGAAGQQGGGKEGNEG
jgi:hypothetical protein